MTIFGIDTKTLFAALLGGIIPTILWLRFWWRDDTHNHPRGILLLTFIAGMVSVMIALPLEKFVADLLFDTTHLIIAAATIEEVLKFGIVAMVAFSAHCVKGPTDYARYLITGALGFAALENTLFLIEPITNQDVVLSLLTGNMRYLGATILHTIASAAIGVMIGFAFYRGHAQKWLHAIVGILTAIALHVFFNFFIMEGGTQNIITVLATLWVSAVLLLIAFEKLRQTYRHHKQFTKPNNNHYA